MLTVVVMMVTIQLLLLISCLYPELVMMYEHKYYCTVSAVLTHCRCQGKSHPAVVTSASYVVTVVLLFFSGLMHFCSPDQKSA